jgi:hypothetical protein
MSDDEKLSEAELDRLIEGDNRDSELTDEVVINLAGMTPLEYCKHLGGVAKKHKVPARLLEKAVEAARKKLPKPEPVEEPIDVEQLGAAAGELITERDILTRFGKAIESAGLVGETDNAKILYLALTSRRFEKPVSLAIKGVSAGGKSFTVESVLKFFPASAYFARTGFSEKALYFSDEDFRHRFIIIYEAVGMGSDYLSYVIRTLLSENRLSYELPIKTEEGIKPQVIEKEGPTGLITTTTAAKLHPENETRLISLSVTDTAQQTRAVMRTLAAGDKRSPIDYGPWQAMQEWLTTGAQRVVVPFATVLAEKIPPVAVRLRRDFAVLLSLIRAHALLHRGTRARDGEDRIVATIDDYVAVRDLVADLYAEGIEATVSATMRQTVKAVQKCLGGSAASVSLSALARELGLDKNSAHHRVKKAIARGYLTNQEDKRGKPAQIVLGDPLPPDDDILPDPQLLEQAVGGVLECWSENGGGIGASSFFADGGVTSDENRAEFDENSGRVPEEHEKLDVLGAKNNGSGEKQKTHIHPPDFHSNTPTVVNTDSNSGSHVCAQCGRVPPDGLEEQFPIDRDLVWLHRECWRFYTAPAHKQTS